MTNDVAKQALDPAADDTHTSAVAKFITRNRGVAAKFLPLTGLLALVILYWILAGDRFMTVENWRILIQQSAALAIIGFGMTFVIVSGSIDLSVGSVAALSGIVGATVANTNGPVVGVMAGLLTGAICGSINGFVFAVMRVPSFIVTLGMLSVARGVTLLYSGNAPQSADTFRALGTEPGIYFVLIIAFIIAFILFNGTSFGRYTRAIGGDERVSRLSGVPMVRMKIAIFVFAGIMTGLGGLVLSARLGVATPNAGVGLELTVIAAVVLGGTPLTGGIGNVWNTIIGALIIQVLLNGLVIIGATPEAQQIAQGIVLVLAVFIALERRKIGIIK